MAKYNYSKREAKRLGVPRVRIGGDGGNVREASRFQSRHGYNPGQYSNDLQGQGVDVNALRSAGRSWGNNMNQGEMRRELSFIADARKNNPYAFYNQEVRRTGSAYDEAKESYKGMLDAMKPRYRDFYNQLDREEQLANARDTQLQGNEETNLRKTMAARGLDATNSGFQYGSDRNKLQGLQNTRREGISLDFNSNRLNTRQQESAEESAITQMIAGTEIDKSAAINNIIHGDRDFFAGRNDVEESKRQFNLNFALTQDENQANRAMQMYQIVSAQKLAEKKFAASQRGKGGGGSKTLNSYRTKLATLVSQAKTGAFGDQPYIREHIQEQLAIKYPELENEINKDISTYLPNGWESQMLSGGGNSYPSEQEINQGLAQMGGASDEQKVQFIRANGGNPVKFGY